AGPHLPGKAAAWHATAFGWGAAGPALTVGPPRAPPVTRPNTQTLAGSPPSTGGGQPDSPPPDEDSPGRDVFSPNEVHASQHGIASSSQQTRQIPPDLAFTLAAGSAVPLSTQLAFVAAATPAPTTGTDRVFS